MPSASIIICTCNRAESLQLTLEAIGRCDPHPTAPAEILVVDNASKDETRQVAEACRLSEFAVNYVYEGKRGKGNAYNAGIAAAQGEICIFTDDDVRPTGDWMLQHLQSYADPEIAAVQGRIELEFDMPPPDWMQRIHRSFLAETLAGESPVFPYTTHLVGANMSFRRTVALEVGPFNPLLGPGRSGFWDESEFSERLMQAGYKQRYQPCAAVRHIISGKRLTIPYFQDAAFRQGVSAYIASQLGTFPAQSHITWSFLRATLRHSKLRLKAMLSGRPYVGLQDDLFYRMALGSFWAHRQGMPELTRRYSE